jgi:predicted nucleic acid-binding protein
VICLDTNYLILGLSRGTREAGQLIEWTRAGELLVAPMIAWFEFRCGPVTTIQIETMRSFLKEVLILDERQVIEAARLFNAVGRKRALRVDALIASSAIVARARLATSDVDHFAAFVPHGLELTEPVQASPA